MTHINIGHWSTLSIPPRAQIIFWRRWHGLRWHRWAGTTGTILRGSLLLGWIELRVWRRPTLHVTVTYPAKDAQP